MIRAWTVLNYVLKRIFAIFRQGIEVCWSSQKIGLYHNFKKRFCDREEHIALFAVVIQLYSFSLKSVPYGALGFFCKHLKEKIYCVKTMMKRCILCLGWLFNWFRKLVDVVEGYFFISESNIDLNFVIEPSDMVILDVALE